MKLGYRWKTRTLGFQSIFLFWSIKKCIWCQAIFFMRWHFLYKQLLRSNNWKMSKNNCFRKMVWKCQRCLILGRVVGSSVIRNLLFHILQFHVSRNLQVSKLFGTIFETTCRESSIIKIRKSKMLMCSTSVNRRSYDSLRLNTSTFCFNGF